MKGEMQARYLVDGKEKEVNLTTGFLFGTLPFAGNHISITSVTCISDCVVASVTLDEVR